MSSDHDHRENLSDEPQDEIGTLFDQCFRRVLGSSLFVAAPVLSRLLDRLGRAFQAQDGRRLTAYQIAMDVFGQAEEFDPQTNSLVRVNMIRLRKLLDRYYAAEGAADPWRVVLPKGNYALQLLPGARGAGDERAGTPGDATDAPYQPTLAVLPVENLDGDAQWQFFCNGVTFELTHLLTQSRLMRVVAPQTMLKVRNSDAAALDVARDMRADFALICGASCRDAGMRFTAQLADVSHGRRLWSEQYLRSLTPGQLHQVQQDIATHVVGLVVSPHGLVERLARHRPLREISSYYAVLRDYEYQEALSPRTHARARDLLEQAVLATPGYAEAWACLGITYGGEEFFGFNRRPDAAPPIERALAAARRRWTRVALAACIAWHCASPTAASTRSSMTPPTASWRWRRVGPTCSPAWVYTSPIPGSGRAAWGCSTGRARSIPCIRRGTGSRTPSMPIAGATTRPPCATPAG